MSTVETTAEQPALLTPLLQRWPERPSGLRSQLNLIRELAIASFKLKYADSALGYVWSLAKPLMLFGTLYLVFALFLLRGRTSPLSNFPAQLLVGFVLYFFFNEATHAGLTAVVFNGDMLRKAYFPRWVLVVAAVVSAGLTLLVNTALVLVLGLAFHWYHIGLQTLLLLPLLLELFLFAIGIGLLLSALYVYYRDLAHIWDVLLQLLLYGSAIVFPLAIVPGRFREFLLWNPAAQIIEDVRRALVTPVIPWSEKVLGAEMIVPLGIVVGLLIVGAWVFRGLGHRFGERL